MCADKTYHMRLFSQEDLTKILNTNNAAISELVNSGDIPYKIINGSIRFYPDVIKQWLQKKPDLKMDDQKYLERYKLRIQEKYPETLKAIKEFSDRFSDPKEPKRFYLEAVKNKKLGIVYYVKYLHNGKLLHSKWNTHTNDRDMAEKYAIENRDRLIKEYLEKRDVKKPYGNMYAIFRNYYAPNSPYMQIDIKRGRTICNSSRNSYHNFINKQFIPYLKKHGIKTFEEIDTPFLSRFQNYMLADKKIKSKIIRGVKPQTLNHYISYISKIFDHLIQEGTIKLNPCNSLLSIKIKKSDLKITGCYKVDKLKGVFNKKWKDEFSYLLSLVIYTINIRNSEIERIQIKDFIMIGQYHFLDIPESKSENGERQVPVHDFVYRKIMTYARKKKLDKEDYIFKLPQRKKLGSDTYKKAYLELAGFMNYTEEQIKKENIRFYSGRHFWKTLMSNENLGFDIEEFFMGHKVNENVAERYNHRDKRGEKKLLEKTKKVFQILDKKIFV